MGIIVYKEEISNLSEVAFVRDTMKQTKIREIDSYEFKKQLAIVLTKINAQMGIKHEISPIYKTDISEMILSRFKNLSLNELEYAFKLERFGEFDDRTDHYHDFNTVYCSTILAKYVEWKRNVKIKHKISNEIEEKEASEEEKKYWTDKAVRSCLEHFIENRDVGECRAHVYDILYDMDYLSKDVEFKKKMYQQAVEVLEFEYSNKKPSNLKEKKTFKTVLEQIKLPKNEKVVIKAKELVLNKFFRELTANKNDFENFSNKFKL